MPRSILSWYRYIAAFSGNFTYFLLIILTIVKKGKLHKNVQNPCQVVTFFFYLHSNISNNRANANFLVFILSLHNVDSGSEHEGRSIEVSVHVSKISCDSNLAGLSLVCAASVEHTREQVLFRLTEVVGRMFLDELESNRYFYTMPQILAYHKQNCISVYEYGICFVVLVWTHYDPLQKKKKKKR